MILGSACCITILVPFINGVIGTWGKATVNRLREHGWRIKYEMLNERGGGCRATVTKGDESYTDTLYFEQAQKSGWTGPENNVKFSWAPGANRELKLRYGVLSKIIKTYIPEVLGNAVDIVEVAEDYVIEETTPAQTTAGARPRTEEVITTTPDERRKGLSDFIESEKNKPKPTIPAKKDAKHVQKEPESAQTTSKTNQSVQSSSKPTAEEGEVIEATAATKGK